MLPPPALFTSTINPPSRGLFPLSLSAPPLHGRIFLLHPPCMYVGPFPPPARICFSFGDPSILRFIAQHLPGSRNGAKSETAPRKRATFLGPSRGRHMHEQCGEGTRGFGEWNVSISRVLGFPRFRIVKSDRLIGSAYRYSRWRILEQARELAACSRGVGIQRTFGKSVHRDIRFEGALRENRLWSRASARLFIRVILLSRASPVRGP